MRLRTLLVLLVPQAMAAGPAAALLGALPACAAACLVEAAGLSACSLHDVPCLCADAAVQQAASRCVLSSCSVRLSLASRNLTATACTEPVRHKTPVYSAVSVATGATAIFFALPLLLAGLWAPRLALGLDDLAVLLALAAKLPGMALTALYVAPGGMGRDAWTLPPDALSVFSRFFLGLVTLYCVEVALIKLALVFFYLRIFPSRPVRRLLWATAACVAVHGLAFALASLLQCRPVAYFWLRWDGEHEGVCIDTNASARSHAILGIALDVWVLAIPTWQLKSLVLDWKKKLGVAAMFVVGTFVTVVSVIRLRAFDFTSGTVNPTWDLFDLGVWYIVEVNVGIMGVCLPSLRLLVMQLWPRVRSSARKLSTGHTINGQATSTTTAMALAHDVSTSLAAPISIGDPPGRFSLPRYEVRVIAAKESGDERLDLDDDNDHVRLVYVVNSVTTTHVDKPPRQDAQAAW